MKIVIVKYNAGNIQSVLFALQRLGYEAEVTDDKDAIENADKVIFPGVGEAGSAMRYLKEKELDSVIRNLTQPVLGVCLGMQLLCKYSDEGSTDCLNIIPVSVKEFIPTPGFKVPQVGWNNIYDFKSPLFKDVKENSFVYNVHSYFADTSRHTIAVCRHGVEYAAAINKDNFYGVQFHTEKSAETGEQILKNFIENI